MTDRSAPSAVAYRLVGITQEVKGAIWALDKSPFRLGRSRQCDVYLAEPSVSRVHCELFPQNGSVRCINCSATGVTLVNGQPAADASLERGDELAIGAYAFVVVGPSEFRASSGNEPAASTDQPDYAFERSGGAALAAFPANVRDVFLLLRVCREAAACETESDVLELVAESLRDRFETTRLWLMQFDARAQRFLPVGTSDPAGAPLAEMRRALLADRTTALPASRECASRALFVCPIVVTDTQKFVIAFETQPLCAKTCEEITDFCAVLAHQIAPIALAIDTRAASRRSLELVARNLSAGEDFRGNCPAANEVRRLTAKAVTNDFPVLILGETGVGKEIVARTIHARSKRSTAPCVVCNCPAIAGSLFESELFGHEAGAFTGAVSRHRGLFEQAHGGTLFLDEVGDLNLEHQAKILRTLENGVIRRVGGTKDIALDVRIVAAANDRLLEAVRAGRFREDLFQRLCGIEILVPPLRERAADIPLLAEHFALECAVATGGPVRTLSEDALRVLCGYDWPGNVRELRQVIGRSYALADRNLLDGDDIALGARATAGEPNDYPPKPLAAIERDHIAAVLEATQGQKSKAADLLGIGRDTLRRKIRIYGLPY